MTSLLDYVEKAHGTEVAGTVSAFFNNAALPAPLNGEFFRSCDSGLMVFLEDEACILRFISSSLPGCPQHDSVDPVIDPDVLQPFGTKTLDDKLYLEIVPGVTCGASAGAYKMMIDRLIAKGYKSGDGIQHFSRNSGLLPDGTPVIIDRGAVLQLNNAVRNVKIALGSQDKFFGPLQETFYQAWPKQQEQPDREKMMSLWAKCREMKEKGMLVAGWNTVTYEQCYNISEIQSVAEAYQTRRHAQNSIPMTYAA